VRPSPEGDDGGDRRKCRRHHLPPRVAAAAVRKWRRRRDRSSTLLARPPPLHCTQPHLACPSLTPPGPHPAAPAAPLTSAHDLPSHYHLCHRAARLSAARHGLDGASKPGPSDPREALGSRVSWPVSCGGLCAIACPARCTPACQHAAAGAGCRLPPLPDRLPERPAAPWAGGGGFHQPGRLARARSGVGCGDARAARSRWPAAAPAAARCWHAAGAMLAVAQSCCHQMPVPRSAHAALSA
jgi:hypothetical protein